MDKYIENRKKEIKELRKKLFKETLNGFLLALLIVPIWLFAAVIAFFTFKEMPPEKWVETEIVYKNISSDNWHARYGDRIVYFLNSEDGGEYIIPEDRISPEELKKGLEPGKTYKIVYSRAQLGSGWEYLEGLSGKWENYLDVSESIEEFKDERDSGIKIIIYTLIIQLFISSLICAGHIRFIGMNKQIKNNIRKTEEKIAEREEKLRRKEMGK